MTARTAGAGEPAHRLAAATDARDPRGRAKLAAPFDAQLRIPPFRPGLVRRPHQVAQLCDTDAPPVVVVSAPTGYGKTMLLAEWAETDPRSFAWVSVTEADNNALVLLAYVVQALDAVEPFDPLTLSALTRPEADLTTALLPRLGSVMQTRARPFVLVLDDVHLLHAPDCVKVISTLTEQVAAGSQVVLAGRSDPPMLGRLRASRRLVRLGADDLALGTEDANALLRAAGVDLVRDALAPLVERAEGWPAGLYLAALSLRGQPDVAEAAATFGGDDRLVAELLRDELLRWLPTEMVEFLVRTSVLERLSGPLCDAVLDWSGSGEVLEEVARSNLFLLPLDRSGEWYRYHHLFRDLLRAELRRREPERERDLHARASAWHEAHGDLDAAIRHARAAGDVPRSGALIWRHAPTYLGTGRSVTLERWLDLFTAEEVAAVPELAFAAAWRAATSRNIEQLDHWTAVAERFPRDQVLANGQPVASAVALARAAVAKQGVRQMAEDARLAHDLDQLGSPWRVLARQLEGIALRLQGDAKRARERLEDAIREAGEELPVTTTLSLAQLALIAIDDDAWPEADVHVERARNLVREFDLYEQPAQSIVYALAALVLARHGDAAGSRREWQLAQGLLASAANIGPWLTVETRLVLARAAALCGDIAAARVLLREAGDLLVRTPDPDAFAARLDELRHATDAAAIPVGVTAAPLTTAELRVLRYLPTHLSLAAIADELFVSRNTVKTHAISVYRKLGVSSRPAAVGRARELGLLDE